MIEKIDFFCQALLFRLLIAFCRLLNKDPWVWFFIWVLICLVFCWCLFTSCNIYNYTDFVLQRHWKMFPDMYIWRMQAIMWTMVHSTLYQRRSQRQRENTFVSKRRSPADIFSTFRVFKKEPVLFFFLARQHLVAMIKYTMTIQGFISRYNNTVICLLITYLNSSLNLFN